MRVPCILWKICPEDVLGHSCTSNKETEWNTRESYASNKPAKCEEYLFIGALEFHNALAVKPLEESREALVHLHDERLQLRQPVRSCQLDLPLQIGPLHSHMFDISFEQPDLLLPILVLLDHLRHSKAMLMVRY